MSEGIEMLSGTLNGSEFDVRAEANETLAHVLRERLDVKSVKLGCDDGSCGTCTILLDGVPVNACLVLALTAYGRAITTVEGLAVRNEMSALQRAFVEHGAAQCGFCIPGMLLSAHALMERSPRADREAIRTALSGNLCRCTGYQKQVAAVLSCAGAEAETAR